MDNSSGTAPTGQPALVSDGDSVPCLHPPGFDQAYRLRTEPDPERLSCWCKGWGHFYNSAKEPPELTYCGNCADAKMPDPWTGLSDLEKDLMLARIGDYPGSAGCKRIAAAYDALAARQTTHKGTVI